MLEKQAGRLQKEALRSRSGRGNLFFIIIMRVSLNVNISKKKKNLIAVINIIVFSYDLKWVSKLFIFPLYSHFIECYYIKKQISTINIDTQIRKISFQKIINNLN